MAKKKVRKGIDDHPVVLRAAEFLDENPAMIDGEWVPERRVGETTGFRRSYERLFEGSPNFPKGIPVGKTETLSYREGDDRGRPQSSKFDLSENEIAKLRAVAYGYEFKDSKQRAAESEERTQKIREIQKFGRTLDRTDGGSGLDGLLGHLSPRQKAALFRALADAETEEDAPAEPEPATA